MAIRISGLNSGLDTDSIVQELVSSYSLKTEKYEKQQTKLEWKQDAWQSLNTKIYSLYTNVSNMRYSSAYSLKKTTVSDNSKASVTAGSDAVTGTQKLNILQMAQASYLTGGYLGKDVKSSTTLKELGYTGGAATIKLKTADGEEETFNIGQETKVSEVLEKLASAGLNANLDTNNGRIFLSAKESGAAGDFELVGDGANGEAALKALGLKTYDEAYELYKTAGGKVESYLTAQVDAYKALQQQIADLEASKATPQATIDEYERLLEHQEARLAHNETYAALQKAGLASKEVTLDDGTTERQGITSAQLRDMEAALGGNLTEEAVAAYIADANNGITMVDGATAADVYNVLKDNEDNVATAAAYQNTYGDLISKSPAQIQEALDAIGEDGYTAAKEEIAAIDIQIASVRAEMSQNEYGYLVEENQTQEALDAAIAALVKEADAANAVLTDPASKAGAATKINGQDAIITLNGVEFTSSKSTFTINGLTIEATGVTGAGDDKSITINTSVDSQGIYDKIKDFLTEYNSVINEITKLYNAESASDYEPLTDEERESMSDEQIEKWENKIKSALLRRDSSLGGVMNAMINSMSRTYEVNGTKFSLGSFGISTLGYLNAAENEQYAYHIDGDEDDENVSGETDKLMAAIQEDPDQVMEFMKQLTSNLYSSIDDKMKSTELSSAYKVYNDKELDNELEDIEDLIEKWEDKITDYEDYWYGKFSDMEVALSKLNSQSSSLSGLLGTS